MTSQELCERADYIGYRIAKGQDAVDCMLANTGQDWTSLVVIGVLFVLAGLCVIAGHWLSRRPRA